jgi:hypothetical protein
MVSPLFGRKREEGFLLISSIVIALFLAILLAGALMRMNWESRLSIAQEGNQAAFYAAEAGLERTIAQLRADPDSAPAPGSPPDVFFTNEPLTDGALAPTTVGFYTVTVYPFYLQDNWPVVPVSVVGFDETTDYQRRFDVEIRVVNPGAFFIFSPYDIHVASGSLINGDIFGRDIHFHYDADLGDITIDDDDSFADVFYMRSYHGYSTAQQMQHIHLNDGPPEQKQALTFADIDFERYEELADNGGVHLVGDTNISGTLSTSGGGTTFGGQTPTNGVIYVEGDVIVNGDITVDDPRYNPIIIVATGTIRIEGNVQYIKTRAQGDKNKLGLFAGGDVVIAPFGLDLNVQAQILVQGEKIQAVGDPGTLGTFDFLGSMVVKGKEGVTAMDLLAFSQRTYDYDEYLLEDELIPGVNSFVNLRSWEEVDKQASPPTSPGN